MISTITPLAAGLIVAVLHAVDYYLTLVGQLAYQRAGGAAFMGVGGSYELNPIFEKSVDRVAWVSTRFVLSIVVLAFAFAGIVWLAGFDPTLAWLPPFLIGMFVFTRIPVIAKHLQNLWTFRQRRLGRVEGTLTWQRPAIFGVSVGHYAGYAAVIAVAELVSPSPWFLGGVVGLAGLIAYLLLLSAVARKKAARAASPAAEPSRPAA